MNWLRLFGIKTIEPKEEYKPEPYIDPFSTELGKKAIAIIPNPKVVRVILKNFSMWDERGFSISEEQKISFLNETRRANIKGVISATRSIMASLPKEQAQELQSIVEKAMLAKTFAEIEANETV